MHEPSLSDRRDDLMCRYFFRDKCHLLNPAYNCILNNNLQTFFTTTDPEKQLIMRINNTLADLNIPTQPVLPYKTPDLYSWCIKRTSIDLEFVGPDTKKITMFNPIFQNHIRTTYSEYQLIYTDGSKDEHGVGSAAVINNSKLASILPSVASIYTAELHAIKLAGKLICKQLTENPRCKKFLICSDSLSAIQDFNTVCPKNHFLH